MIIYFFLEFHNAGLWFDQSHPQFPSPPVPSLPFPTTTPTSSFSVLASAQLQPAPAAAVLNAFGVVFVVVVLTWQITPFSMRILLVMLSKDKPYQDVIRQVK